MRIALVVANEGYRDEEYDVPLKLLKNAGFTVSTIAKNLGTAVGKLGGTCEINLTLQELNMEEYQALVFIGGPGATIYQDDERVHELIKQTKTANKLLAAICIAPTILAKAGALRGKKATVWNGDTTQGPLLESCGAEYLNEPVVIDENLITANGPEAANQFAKAIIKHLKNQEENQESQNNPETQETTQENDQKTSKTPSKPDSLDEF